MMHWQHVPLGAAVASTVWLLVQHFRGSDGKSRTRQADAQAKQSAHQPQGTPAAKQPSSRRPAQGLSTPSDVIPQHELTQLQSFLRKVYRWRGWQGGSFHITQAWHAVEQAAATPEGGSWQHHFTGRQLTDANCDALLLLIDRRFCAGKLLRRMRTSSGSSSSSAKPVGPQQQLPGANNSAANSTTSSCCSGLTDQAAAGARAAADGSNPQQLTAVAGPALGAEGTPEAQGVAVSSATISTAAASSGELCCRVVQSWDAAWLAYFDTQDNTIYINCWRWAKDVSPDALVNCEGVVCTSRLQMLMHTLAHELVHAVVYHLFPDMDRSSPAYTINNRHGPIFHLLNKQLFGHSSDALEKVHVLPRRLFV